MRDSCAEQMEPTLELHTCSCMEKYGVDPALTEIERAADKNAAKKGGTAEDFRSRSLCNSMRTGLFVF